MVQQVIPAAGVRAEPTGIKRRELAPPIAHKPVNAIWISDPKRCWLILVDNAVQWLPSRWWLCGRAIEVEDRIGHRCHTESLSVEDLMRNPAIAETGTDNSFKLERISQILRIHQIHRD